MNYMSRYLLATYGAGGVIGAVLFGFAVTLAIERGMGWLQLRYTTPNHPGVLSFCQGRREPGVCRRRHRRAL